MKKGGGTTTLSRYKKREPFVIQSLRKKTNKRTNEQIQRKKREKDRSGDCDTLLHSGVPEYLGEGRVQSQALGEWGRCAKVTPIWRPNR